MLLKQERLFLIQTFTKMNISSEKEQYLKKLREDILQLVQDGNSYTAIEKTNVYVRQMKKIDQLEESLMFMMRVALILMEREDWHASSVCAYRAISLFPSESKTIRKILKQLFFDFAEKARPELVCPELFGFYNKLSTIFHNQEEELLLKQAWLADQANNYYYAQTFYSELLIKYTQNENDDQNESPNDEKIDKVISSLGILIWKWIQSEGKEGEKQQKNISQYIFARCVLLILTIRGHNITEIAQKFVAVFKSSSPENINVDEFCNLPLFHFIDFFIKAIDRRSKETAAFLIKKYEPALNVDSDIIEYANTAKEALNSRDASGLAGLGSMLQSFLGRMLSGNGNDGH